MGSREAKPPEQSSAREGGVVIIVLHPSSNVAECDIRSKIKVQQKNNDK